MGSFDFTQSLHRIAVGTSVVFGTKANVDTAPTVLGSDTSQLVEVMIQCPLTNTTGLLVGDTTSQPFVLDPGDVVVIPSLELSDIEVKANGSDTAVTVNFATSEAN